MEQLKKLLATFGWPRIIIFLFLLSLFIAAPFVNVSIGASLSDTINRFGMNALLVLAMVPMVQAGCGLNFGLSLGVIGGLLGATISMELNLLGWVGFFSAVFFTIVICAAIGYAYGKLLNLIKGEEMTIALYVGFAAVMFMSILWLLLPYTNPTMVWGYAGKGLRTTITLEGYWLKILNNLWAFQTGSFVFPTGLILFVFICFFIMKIFMKTRTGTALTAVCAGKRGKYRPSADYQYGVIDRHRRHRNFAVPAKFRFYSAVSSAAFYGVPCGSGYSDRRSLGQQSVNFKCHAGNIFVSRYFDNDPIRY